MKRLLLFGNLPYALPILRPLQAAIRARGGDARWFFHGDGAQFLTSDEVLMPDARAVLEFAPEAVFAAGNWVPHFFPGVKVHLGHGFSVPGKENTYSIRGLFDIYCTFGNHDHPEYLRLSRAMGHFRVAQTGWTKLDPLFDPQVAALPVPRDRPVILYASTFTRRLTSAPYVLDTVAGLSHSGRWRWLVTLHPKLPDEIKDRWRALESEHLQYVETKDVVPFLKTGDLMLCDTSSILMEFMTQVRPVVTYRNGGAEPAPHLINVTESAELEAAIERGLRREPEHMARVRTYAEDVHLFRDGRSSERVLEAVERFIQNDERSTLRRKPLNLWRKLQIRSRLHHWQP